MQKWNLIVDVASCTNCNNCALAVYDEFVGNEWPGYAAEMPKHGHRWIDIKRKERGSHPMLDVAYVPTMCQHCDDAPCVKAARDGAVRQRDDGIVIIDPEKAKGQKQLVDACPYGAIWWNEEKETPQHWPFDAHLLDAGWKTPRCAQVCATGVFRAIKTSDAEMGEIIKSEGLERLDPDADGRPRVWYKNLYRYNKAFIGGAVSALKDGVEDFVEGAAVALKKDGQIIAETQTDGFGQFKFDGLEPGAGEMVIEAHAPGRELKTVTIDLQDSVVIGDIVCE